jgi:hypothetical protein
MIARVIKNIMRAEMRDKTKNVHWQRMAQAPSPSLPRIELGTRLVSPFIWGARPSTTHTRTCAG